MVEEGERGILRERKKDNRKADTLKKRIKASEKKNDLTPQLPSVGKVARKDPLLGEIEGYSVSI